MYTTTNSIPDHAPILAYCHVGSMMSRFSMMETRRAIAARQPLRMCYVSIPILTGGCLTGECLQSSQTKQTHDKSLLPFLHLQSSHLNSRKHHHSHVLKNSHYRAHSTGICRSDAVPRPNILVPGVFNWTAREYGKHLHGKARNGDEADNRPCCRLEALGWENTKVKQYDRYLDEGHEYGEDCCRDEQ